MKKSLYLLSAVTLGLGLAAHSAIASDLINDIAHVQGALENAAGAASPELSQVQTLLEQAIASKDAGDEAKAQELIDQAKTLLGMK